MGKNIRKVIWSTFIFTVFLGKAPYCLNPIITRAYAENMPSLKNIYLSEGDNIKFSENIHSYIVDIDKDTDELFVKAKPYDLDDTVKINEKVVTKEDNYKEHIKLEKGKNVVEIEVIDDRTKLKEVYKVYIYRGGKDAVYLKDITINGETIGFDKTTTSYDLELDENSKIVDLETVPGNGKYSITVNDIELSEKNSIKLKFKSIGKYTINISVKDEDTDRIGKYTLNIYFGIPVSPNVLDSINNVLKPNQWVLVYGRWRYNDAFGVSLKDTWFYDSKYKGYFHFNKRGNMDTGWIQEDGKYYYLNSYGFMQTGWIFDENEQEWYLLGPDGAMKTGWQKDGENWYYLRRNGSMATGWIVSRDNWYYLNSNGTMRTGWMYYGKKWYYLNSEGAMETGWIKYDNQWYYLNSDGSMKSGEWYYYGDKWYYFNYVGNMRSGWLNKDDKYYYFNKDGSLVTTPITIDGYTYEINEDGSVKVD